MINVKMLNRNQNSETVELNTFHSLDPFRRILLEISHLSFLVVCERQREL
jgi:hypothetical protein